MEPITHALTSLALARATREKLPRFGTAMLVTSGVAADLDFVSYFGGALAFLHFHRAVLHSLLGSFVMCCLVAAAFCFVVRSGGKNEAEYGAAKLRFGSALLVCAAGVAAHIVLDLASGIGVRLLWPFSGSWSSWDLLANLDVWILLLLVAGLSLPHLGRLVSDEIGEHKSGTPGRVAAIVTLVLLSLYIGMREMLHWRAIGLLVSRDYHGQPPQKSGAFPTGSNPFAWRGLIATNGAIDEMSISLLPGGTFDPERALTHYKPEESPAIVAAQNTSGGELFLTYARFPFMAVEPRDTGVEVILRDLRFSADDTAMDDVMLNVELDGNSQVVRQEMRFAGLSKRR